MSFLYPGRWLKTKAQAIVRCLFYYLCDTYPDLFKDLLVKESRLFLRREVFVPWKFQRTIDLEGAGGLNYECLNSVRSGVEELPKNTIGLMPEATTVGAAARKLEGHASADHGLHINESTNSHGPSFSFDIDILLRLTLQGRGLNVYAETTSMGHHQPVMIAHALDGAQLTNALGHVTAGIKIVDPRAEDPITGIPVCVEGKYQSRDLCFVCQITFGRDCKQLRTECFQDFFEYFNGMVKVPAFNGMPELSNFVVVSPQDMSSTWKTTGLGGGCFNKEDFCYCCDCKNNLMPVSATGADRCHDCARLGIDRCFCHPVLDVERIEETRQLIEDYALEAIDVGLEKLMAVSRESKIETNPHQANKLEDSVHIEHQPTTEKASDDFKALLTRELKLRLKGPGRKAALQLDLEGRRDTLKYLVEDEKAILQSLYNVNRHDKAHSICAKLLCEQAIPCVLHAEMRINEKLLCTVLSMGMDRYQDGDSQTRKSMIAKVTECMRFVVMGDEASNRSAQWTFPPKKGGKEAQSKSMPNAQSRKCVCGLKALVALVFSADLDEVSLNPEQTRSNNQLKLTQWHGVIDAYIELIELSRKHEDFTDQELDTFHALSASFMAQCVDLLKPRAVHNQLHSHGGCRASHLLFEETWESMQVLTTGMGGYESETEALLLQQHQPWRLWW